MIYHCFAVVRLKTARSLRMHEMKGKRDSHRLIEEIVNGIY